MSTYRELFKLSAQPEEVITMDEAIVSRQEEIVNNYIITENLQDSFDQVFHHLTLDKGKGFWIQGAYGSGKSHFMSFLTVLLHHDKYWERIPEKFQREYRTKLKSKKFLTVNFTLSEVNNLQVKIFDEIEKALHKDGHQVYIKNDEKIVKQFLKELELMQQEKVFGIIEEECGASKKEWDKLVDTFNVKELARIIIKYRQTRGSFSQKEYREIIYPSIKDGLQQIMDNVDKYYDGIVIFIDELSEFLQKKKAKNEESDALETIQALGQRIKNSPIWVMAAVQKNPATIIDESLYISDEEEKVFDRFDQIVLSEADIEEIIDKRIIIKDESNCKSIRFIYQELKKEIPQLVEHITLKKFIKLYPFHYEFVNALMYLSSFGSRQRVAISECWKIVNNNLNKDARELITTDMLYDIFRDSIIHDNFKQYYDIYENLYEDIISRPNFENDRQIARRAIKTLMINSILRKQPLNSIEITHLLMVDMDIGMGLSLVYEEIYYTLREIYEKARGRGINLQSKDSDSEKIEQLWEIDPGSSGVKVEPEIIEETKLINENDLALAIQKFINANNHFFANYRTEWNSRVKMLDSFMWRNTERYGITVMKNLKTVQDLPEIDPVKDDTDFALVIGFPIFAGKKEKIKNIESFVEEDTRIIYWVPENINDELKYKLTRMVAVENLLNKYDNPKDDETREKKLQLETRFNQYQEDLSTEIENCYLDGIMINKYKREENLQQFNTFNHLLEYMIAFSLDEMYPDHPRYSKKVSRMQSNKLIRDFIIPRAAKEQSNEIMNVGEPFGIVEKNKGRYELKLKNKIFNKINTMIEDGEWHGLDQITKLIRQKPWGIQEIGLEIIVSALIANGECRARTKGGETLNSGNFSRNLVGGGTNLVELLISISKGNLVNNNVWDEILEIMNFLEIDYQESKSLINQNKVWANINNKFTQLQEEVDFTSNLLMELGGDLHQFEDFKSSLSAVKDYKNFLEEVEKLKDIDDSYEGLNRCRHTVLNKFTKINIFQEKHLQLKEILKIKEERLDVKVRNCFDYFSAISVDFKEISEIKEKFSNLGKIINKPGKVKKLLKEAEKVKDKYQEEYIKEHQKYFGAYKKYMYNVKQLKEYETLSLLEDIDKVSIPETLREQLNQIKNNYLPECSIELSKADLKDKPHCNCGFKPDEDFIPLDKNKVREQLRFSIKKYIEKLKQEEYLKQIEHYLEKNPESKVKKLWEVHSYDLEGIMKIVDREFILEVNKAFKSAYPVYIDSRKIMDMFKGSIHGVQITTMGQKVSAFLMKEVKQKIAEVSDEISFERVIVIFSEEPEAEETHFNIKGIKLEQQEQQLLQLLDTEGQLTEDELSEKMEARGYRGMLIKGTVSGMNRKYSNKYNLNLINIKQDQETGQIVYLLNELKKERG